MKGKKKTVRRCLNCGEIIEDSNKMLPRTVCIKCTKEIIEKISKRATTQGYKRQGLR